MVSNCLHRYKIQGRFKDIRKRSIRDTRKSREIRGDSERFYRKDFNLRKCLPFNADFLFHGLGLRDHLETYGGNTDIREDPWEVYKGIHGHTRGREEI
jgi:hypothetical protein